MGAVTDVGTTHSEVAMLCVNLSLSDSYSSRPEFQTRLVINVGDSRKDVVGAAAAGNLSLALSRSLSLSLNTSACTITEFFLVSKMSQRLS